MILNVQNHATFGLYPKSAYGKITRKCVWQIVMHLVFSCWTTSGTTQEISGITQEITQGPFTCSITTSTGQSATTVTEHVGDLVEQGEAMLSTVGNNQTKETEPPSVLAVREKDFRKDPSNGSRG